MESVTESDEFKDISWKKSNLMSKSDICVKTNKNELYYLTKIKPGLHDEGEFCTKIRKSYRVF